jgi:nicotinate-nucleotide adenylyltransferase
VRSGVLGGTFDPPHWGHLTLAAHCRRLLRLDAVFFVPAYLPPHKPSAALTPFPVRWKLLEAAIRETPEYIALPLEAERDGPSYTVETLRELRRRYPEDELWLLIGADSLEELATWKDPAEIAGLARIAAYRRRGASTRPPRVVAGRVQIVEGPLCDVSSSEIRRRVRAGESIASLVPPAVAELVRTEKLYRDPPATEG